MFSVTPATDSIAYDYAAIPVLLSNATAATAGLNSWIVSGGTMPYSFTWADANPVPGQYLYSPGGTIFYYALAPQVGLSPSFTAYATVDFPNSVAGLPDPGGFVIQNLTLQIEDAAGGVFYQAYEISVSWG